MEGRPRHTLVTGAREWSPRFNAAYQSTTVEIMSGGGQPVKLFVGGLPQELTDEEFRRHFGSFGALSDCTIMRDALTGSSRGFGFVVFESGNCAQQCLGAGPHELCGKVVDAKLAVPRDRMPAGQPG